jgi:hypothetical protein
MSANGSQFSSREPGSNHPTSITVTWNFYPCSSVFICGSKFLLGSPAIAATLFRREQGGPWIATAHTGGALDLAGLDISVPLSGLYRGLTFTV